MRSRAQTSVGRSSLTLRPVAVADPDRSKSKKPICSTNHTRSAACVRSTAAADRHARRASSRTGPAPAPRRCRAATAAPCARSPRSSPCRRRGAATAAACRDRASSTPPLASGRAKPSATKVSRREVEFAQHHRVAAAARQAHDGAVVRAAAASWRRPRSSPRPPSRPARRDRAGCPTPAGRGGSSRASCAATGRADCSRPSRNCRASAPRRATPGMLVGPVEDRRQRVAVGGEARIAEARQRARVLRLDPGERALALDLLEPEIGIVVGRGDRRPGIEGHAKTPGDSQGRAVLPMPAILPSASMSCGAQPAIGRIVVDADRASRG